MFIFLLTCITYPLLAQGLYWESEIKTEDGKEIESVVSYRSNMFKQSIKNQETIFRFDKEILYIIDNDKKEYTEMTFAEMEAATKQAMQQMEEMKKQMKDLPPEQRKMMEKMMGNQAIGDAEDEKVEIVKTGEQKTINGFPCTKYVMKKNGKESGSVWITTKVPDFKNMQNDMKKFNKRLMGQMPKMKQVADAMNKIEGFPIQTIIEKMTMTVTKVEKRDIPLSAFEVPKGYKKVSIK